MFMMPKADLLRLTERLADARSRKVVLVSHCILNEGARYQGGATRPGCNEIVVGELMRRGVEYIGCVRVDTIERETFNREGIVASVVDGRGFLMTAIARRLRGRGIEPRLYEHDLMLELQGGVSPNPFEREPKAG